MVLTPRRQRARARLERALPAGPFDVHQLIAHVAARRGRSIKLTPIRTRPGWPSGGVLEDEDDYYVFYDAYTSPWDQQLILSHELLHLILDHEPRSLGEDEMWDTVVPGVGPRSRRRFLGRTGAKDKDERETEWLARVLLEKISLQYTHVLATSTTEETEAVRLRLKQLLGGGLR